MKALINTTNLQVGGGVQVATSFVREALRNPVGIDWWFAFSRVVHDQVRRFHAGPIPQSEVFETSPAVDRDARRHLAEYEAQVAPDCVFTPCGPAYVQFAAPHLMGAGNPWVAHADIHAYRVLKFPKEWVTTFLRSIYRGYWYRRTDMLVVQTEYVRQGYHRRIGLPLSRIAVVSNTCGQHYLDDQDARPFPPPGRRVRILVFSAPYKHKRIEIIAQVARELKDRHPELDFEFVTTLPEQDPLWRQLVASARERGVESSVVNVGPVSVADGPALYQGCDICFLPTVLECFSATYPEAMAMGLPIVTTDLGFLRDVCRDAALYFRPDDAAGAAARILQLLDSEALWNRQVAEGKAVLARLPDAADKFREFVRLLCKLRPDKAPGPLVAAAHGAPRNGPMASNPATGASDATRH